MILRHLTDRDKHCYAFTGYRKPEKIFDGLCKSLHIASKRHKELKRTLNRAIKSIPTLKRYYWLSRTMNQIQATHDMLMYQAEVLVWLRHEYVDFIKKHPEFKNVRVKCK